MLLSPRVSKTEWRFNEPRDTRDSDTGRHEEEGSEVVQIWTRVMEETTRLAPQSCVVSVQARAERSTCYKQLGARVVVAVGIHSVGEGMNVWEVTPPCVIMILRAKQKGGEREMEIFRKYSQSMTATLCVGQNSLSLHSKRNLIPAILSLSWAWVCHLLGTSCTPQLDLKGFPGISGLWCRRTEENLVQYPLSRCAHRNSLNGSLHRHRFLQLDIKDITVMLLWFIIMINYRRSDVLNVCIKWVLQE